MAFLCVLNKSNLGFIFRQFDFLCSLGKDSILNLVWSPWNWKDHILCIRHTVGPYCPFALVSTSRLCLGVKVRADWLDLSWSTWDWIFVGTHAAVTEMRMSNPMKPRPAGTCRHMLCDLINWHDPTTPAKAWRFMLWMRKSKRSPTSSGSILLGCEKCLHLLRCSLGELWRQIWALCRMESKSVCNHPFLLSLFWNYAWIKSY